MNTTNTTNTAAVKTAAHSLHPATTLGSVTIRVADAARSVRFYQEALGFVPVSAGMPALGASGGDGSPIVILKETPGARPARHASGLYHFAVLVPTRPALGRVLRRLAKAEVRIGEADHLVSEALYLSDPDGNGIEVYRDRPRDQWRWEDGTVKMATEPLDLGDLLRDGENEAEAPDALPAGTRIGHVHLQVSDVRKAVEFYHGILGFDIVSAWQGAAFVSAGGYHHHLGLNSWSSRGAPPAPPGSSGLESFVIKAPNAKEQGRLSGWLKDAGVEAALADGVLRFRDPWNIGVEVTL
ncbi:MAG: VOC family protein [Spirochaetia bacterium]